MGICRPNPIYFSFAEGERGLSNKQINHKRSICNNLDFNQVANVREWAHIHFSFRSSQVNLAELPVLRGPMKPNMQ